MKIYVNVKKAGSRRAVLEKVPYETELSGCALRDLLAFLVREEVAKYNRKVGGAEILQMLSAKEIEDAAETGKVGFGAVYRDGTADEEKAVGNALQCFDDGLVRVFLNGEEVTALDQQLDLAEGDVVTLMRLVFLSGRMW